MKLSPLQEQALAFLATYLERRQVYSKANDAIEMAISQVTAEYTHGLHPIDGQLNAVLCGLLDAIWGQPSSDLTSYFLHECIGPLGHGGGPTCCGKEWKLRNLKDLRAYIIHTNHQCKQLEGKAA